eukprot:scaffold49388_cov28-Tisochrysis_lutea.AAC.1
MSQGSRGGFGALATAPHDAAQSEAMSDPACHCLAFYDPGLSCFGHCWFWSLCLLGRHGRCSDV